MKKFLRLFTFLVLLLPMMAKAQILEPVQWTVETEKLNKNEYNIVFKAEIEDHWHLYSQYTPFGGPMPLYFEFTDTLGIERIGGVVEPKAIIKYSDIFEIDEHFFENEAVFTQKVKLVDDAATVAGVITGQACKESCAFIPQYPTYKKKRKRSYGRMVRLVELSVNTLAMNHASFENRNDILLHT